jgi:hypothetical protein
MGLKRLSGAGLFAAAVVAAPIAATHFTEGTVPGTFVGPDSSAEPYLIPATAGSGWETLALLSVGDVDEENGYAMVGIPDGLGALPGKFQEGRYVADKAYMTVFMNHEIGAGGGAVRAHGQAGAFVSEWAITLNSLEVKRGNDLIHTVYKWDAAANLFVFDAAIQFSRLCSADLPAYKAFYNPASGKGFDGRLFLNGEESGVQGRQFGHVLTGDEKGTSYELAFLGRASWENSVAHPNTGDKTIVVGLDDTSSPGGEVYVYVGNKQSTGNPVEQAGLVGGSLFGIKVTNGGSNYANGAVPLENAGAINGSFTLMKVTDPKYVGDGSVLQTFSTNNGFTKFARPEDGAWDTRDPRVFYFVVTGGINNNQGARLYKLTFSFDNDGNPTGGTIAMIVDRKDLLPAPPANVAQFDNMTVDGDGMVIIQEDPGGNTYLARVWQVNPSAPAGQRAASVLIHDPARFSAGPPAGLTIDEESSGIIEVTDLVKSANWFEKGRRYFLADVQAHYAIPGELVEGGQLLLIASPKK